MQKNENQTICPTRYEQISDELNERIETLHLLI